MNLQKFETWFWGEVKLASHEVVAVAGFIEALVQNRTFVDVLSLVPGVAPYWGAVKLAADEIEKIKAFVGEMKNPTPVVEMTAGEPTTSA